MVPLFDEFNRVTGGQVTIGLSEYKISSISESDSVVKEHLTNSSYTIFREENFGRVKAVLTEVELTRMVET